VGSLTRAQLKNVFLEGAVPSESDYWNLIDSLANTLDDVQETVPSSAPAAGSILGGVAGYALQASIDALTANTPTNAEFDALPQTYYNKTESDDRYIQSSSANANVSYIPGLLVSVTELFHDEDHGVLALETKANSNLARLDALDVLGVTPIATGFTANISAKTMVLDPTWTLSFEGAGLNSHISHLATQVALSSVQSDFNTALATKASASHTHSAYATTVSLDANYASLIALISAKAPTSHTHAESEITGLDAKFTTPVQVQTLIDASAQTLNQTTLLDDFYEKPEVDEAIRIALGAANSEHPAIDYGLVDSNAPGYIRNKPSLFSGSFNDLTNVPIYSPWVIDYGLVDPDAPGYIRNKPSLFSGSFNDLTNVPIYSPWVIDYGLVDPDAPGYIRNKPSLFSGSFNDLTNVPSHSPWDAERNIQADWSVTDMTADSYIRNKPSLSGGSTAATTPDEDLLYALSVIWQQLTGEMTEGSQVVAAITGSSIYATDTYFDGVYTRGVSVTPYVQWE
tara:strand:+ start:12320 stop:13858 length:1539 start_codon:yes stop_codon:yes gene_type:complete